MYRQESLPEIVMIHNLELRDVAQELLRDDRPTQQQRWPQHPFHPVLPNNGQFKSSTRNNADKSGCDIENQLF